VTGQDTLDPEGANLASVLNTLRNNNEKLFREIQAETQRFVPTIRDFSTPVIHGYRGSTSTTQTTLGVQEKDTPDGVLYQLDQKNVRAQKVELDRRETQLMVVIEKGVDAKRKQLDQQVQERRARLEEIERLIHPHAKGKGEKEFERERYDKK
jgi:hypothetical protein